MAFRSCVLLDDSGLSISEAYLLVREQVFWYCMLLTVSRIFILEAFMVFPECVCRLSCRFLIVGGSAVVGTAPRTEDVTEAVSLAMESVPVPPSFKRTPYAARSQGAEELPATIRNTTLAIDVVAHTSRLVDSVQYIVYR